MIILVRHGQTAANAGGLLLGRSDPALTELGQQQARAVADALATSRVARIVTSPLARCRQTAEHIARGGPVQVDERWIEIDYGGLEAMPLGEVPVDVWATWRRDPAHVPAGGESLVDVGRRVAEACDDLRDEATGGDVVVVSHVSPIKAAVAWALGVGQEVSWRMFLDVAAVTRIGIGPNGPSLRSYNDTSHLRDLTP